MKFTLKKNDMIDVLSKVQGLTGRRSSLAITECIQIKASDTHVQLTATDLETCFEGNLPALVETPGTIAISARKLYEIAREFPSSDILIDETENRWINISDNKVHYHLMGMNAEDFPEAPVFEEVDFFEVQAEGFKKMIDKSIIISGVGEDKKPHINGVLLERQADQNPARLRMVSTDGSRLSTFDLVCAQDAAMPSGPNVLIPKKGLHEAAKFISASGVIRIGIIDSYFVIKSTNDTIAIRMLEGLYPQYNEIVFRQEGHLIHMEKEPFLNMLKRMSILCTDSYRAAIFSFDEGALAINATNPDIGESKEDMALDYEGEKIEAAFNPRFFIDTLNGIDDESITINIVSDHKPCLVQGAEDKSYLSAIMPMRI
jgi:DNA polymerase III subunit beta